MSPFLFIYRNMHEASAQSHATDESKAQQLLDISMELCGLSSQQP